MEVKNRVETIAAACYHKYSQHFVDLERFYEIAKEDGRIEEREECANVCEELPSLWPTERVIADECSSAIRARTTK
jgi:hypothetical protein